MAESRDAAESLENTNKLDSILTPSIKLDIPGESYYLTTFLSSDVEALHEIMQGDSISPYLVSVPHPYTLPDATFWVSAQVATSNTLLSIQIPSARKAALFTQPYAIPLQVLRHASPSSPLIGCVSLTPVLTPTPPFASDQQVVELGYYLHPDHRRKHIIPTAARALLSWAAKEFDVEIVECSADILNIGSQKIIQGLVKSAKSVQVGERVYSWPEGKLVQGKVVEGKDVESSSFVWRWGIGHDDKE